MNYQYTQLMPSGCEEHDQMLFRLPLSGSASKKTYYFPIEKQVIAAYIEPTAVSEALYRAPEVSPGLVPLPWWIFIPAVALWIAAGGHPEQIAARAGHTSVSVVLDRYGHLLPNHEDAFMQALETLAARPEALNDPLASPPMTCGPVAPKFELEFPQDWNHLRFDTNEPLTPGAVYTTH